MTMMDMFTSADEYREMDDVEEIWEIIGAHVKAGKTGGEANLAIARHFHDDQEAGFRHIIRVVNGGGTVEDAIDQIRTRCHMRKNSNFMEAIRREEDDDK